jgi:hypothetical protein
MPVESKGASDCLLGMKFLSLRVDLLTEWPRGSRRRQVLETWRSPRWGKVLQAAAAAKGTQKNKKLLVHKSESPAQIISAATRRSSKASETERGLTTLEVALQCTGMSGLQPSWHITKLKTE